MKQIFQTEVKSMHEKKVPGNIKTDTIITPIGQMVACSTEKGICLLEFLSHPLQETGMEALAKKFNRKVKEGSNEHISQVKQELEEYFAGKRMQFNVLLHPIGTVFQLSVWQNLQEIPYGTTTTYLRQALSMGNPKAVRAVAAANGQNKIAVIIPCHRVIGSNGKLTGYAGGMERKRWLLNFEQNFSGSRYLLF